MNASIYQTLGNIRYALLASAMLGLAPFFPEPHIIGKIRWVAGGAVGMQPIDWFDLFWHGWPFVWLLIAAVLQLNKLRTQTNSND